jgi:hypothetical protein
LGWARPKLTSAKSEIKDDVVGTEVLVEVTAVVDED